MSKKLQKIQKTFTFDLQKSADTEERTFEAVITTKNIDRDQEVVIAEGIDYKSYLTNPVVLWNHNFDKVIGTALSVRKYKDEIRAKVKFVDNDDDADKVYNLVKQGALRGLSIGFIVKDYRQPTSADLKEYGKDLRGVITKAELYEFSVVTVPSNRESLMTSVKSMVKNNEITAEKAKTLFDIEIESEEKTFDLDSIDIEINKKEEVKKDISELIAERVEKEVLIKKGFIFFD